MNYYIGIDGGGTKTAFVCYDEDGNLVSSCIKPSCHILQVNDQTAQQILQEGVSEVLAGLDEEKSVYICAGLAGYGKNQQLRTRIETIAAKSFQDRPYILYNDGEIALAGALNGQDGILVICGTGSIALAKIHDEFIRCGGWGYMIGDEGSAYWLAKKLLQAFCMQADGRQKQTMLYSYLKEKWQLNDDYDVIPFVASTLNNQRDAIAALAIQAYELALKHDEAALVIYQEAAKEIARMIDALATNFSGKIKVSYTGGVWKAKELFQAQLAQYVKADIELIDPVYDPAKGASMLAKQFFSQNSKK
ncbi:MAG: hypothetical protein MR210_04415 [Erysipelotrichaceae bacterium]|nr:hypothetical protein [Erysipelotrichaceae bacterium]MDY5252615.1 BadF/BadG/BcrA/BcrD ATPase family protein [Erysipelotrichaceae bacterium]